MQNEDLNRLKVVLVEKKRTNKWLAEQLGKDQGTVSKWRTKNSQSPMETFAKILDVDDDELVCFEEFDNRSAK